MWQRSFDALGTAVGIACDGAAGALLAPRLATYAEAEDRAAVAYAIAHGAAWTVSRDGDELYASSEPLDVIAAFELDLYRTVLARQRGWVLHAGAAAIRDRAWVLAGPSGAGKSTLVLALVGRGAQYLSDEYVCIDGPSSVRGLARPIAFDPREPARPAPAGMAAGESVVRSPDGDLLRSQLFLPAAAAIRRAPLPLGGVVLLEHGGAGPYVAERLTAGQAVIALWPSTLSPGAPVLAVASESLPRGAWHLRTRSVDEACAEIERLALAC